MTVNNNDDRAAFAQQTRDNYVERYGLASESTVQASAELIADVKAWADERGYDAGSLVAEIHFDEEFANPNERSSEEPFTSLEVATSIPDRSTAERVRRGKVVALTYNGLVRGELETVATDLQADLMHAAHLEGWDFASADAVSDHALLTASTQSFNQDPHWSLK